MKKYWYIVVIFMLLCSCEKDATEIVLQEVKGARDCVDGSYGSWSDGVVTLLSGYSDSPLRFVVQSSGILKFKYRVVTGLVGKPDLYVKSQLLNRDLISTTSTNAWKKCNVGMVDAGDIISIGFTGSQMTCKVKNVKIVCHGCTSGDEIEGDDF